MKKNITVPDWTGPAAVTITRPGGTTYHPEQVKRPAPHLEGIRSEPGKRFPFPPCNAGNCRGFDPF